MLLTVLNYRMGCRYWPANRFRQDQLSLIIPNAPALGPPTSRVVFANHQSHPLRIFHRELRYKKRIRSATALALDLSIIDWSKRSQVAKVRALNPIIKDSIKYNVANPQDGFAAATNATREVSYALDAVSNRTNVVDNLTSTAYTVNNLNQYTAVGSTSLSYDTRGNLTGDGAWTYTYNLENKLIGANKSGTSVQYLYDSFGRRISKTVNGVKRVYVYSGDNLIEERDATGILLANYVYGGLDVPVKAVIGGVTYYPHQDALRNVVALTTAAGVIVEQYEYDIYGKVTVKNGVGVVISTPPLIPFLFTGRELDNETGLYHYRARAYSADWGRFLQADPINFNGGDTNLYRYVHNNPINYIDPLGLMDWTDVVTELGKMLLPYHLDELVDPPSLGGSWQNGTEWKLDQEKTISSKLTGCCLHKECSYSKRLPSLAADYFEETDVSIVSCESTCPSSPSWRLTLTPPGAVPTYTPFF